MDTIVGVDEVGRGAWAGPVCVAAVRLFKPITGLKDSKQLLPNRRLGLAHLIKQNAAVGLGWASPAEIDELGLTQALRLAITRALRIFEQDIDVVIDGAYNFLPERINVSTLVKADQTVPSVSAASIVAKVARDNLMKTMSGRFPDYGFEEHVGYGTQKHQLAINRFGSCFIHRQSFQPIHQLKFQIYED